MRGQPFLASPDAYRDLWGLCFGDGSTGNVTISGSTTLTAEVFYKNLTITSTGRLICRGYGVFVRDRLIIESGGVIHNNGQDGFGAAGGPAVANTQWGGAGAGGNGQTGNGSNGIATTTAYGGAGGAGGAGLATTGGTGGAVTAPGATFLSPRILFQALHPALMTGASQTRYRGGAGAGGGGGDAVNSGGGGGGGGGVLFLSARQVINQGTISSNGGIGTTRSVGNVGGGGGGGAGCVVLVHRFLSGAGVIQVNGGAGGAGVGTGLAGVAGSTGITFQVRA